MLFFHFRECHVAQLLRLLRHPQRTSAAHKFRLSTQPLGKLGAASESPETRLLKNFFFFFLLLFFKYFNGMPLARAPTVVAKNPNDYIQKSQQIEELIQQVKQDIKFSIQKQENILQKSNSRSKLPAYHTILDSLRDNTASIQNQAIRSDRFSDLNDSMLKQMPCSGAPSLQDTN